jgi:purine catabolism regulator
VHPVGQAEDVRAFLVVASRNATTSRTRDLAAQAAALIDLLLRTHDDSATERLGRDVMMRVLLGETVGSPSSLLRQWGVRDESMAAFVISSRTRSVDLERLVSRWFREMGAALTVTMEKGRLTGLLSKDAVDDFAERVESFAGGPRMPVRCGIGAPAALDSLSSSMIEARQAHETAVLDGRRVVRYEALPTVRLVLNSLDKDAISQIGSSIEAISDHPTLTETLHVYLSEHGSWGVTAQRLGIHRHTLKNRIHQIEELTGLSMSNPDDRFSAWLALRSTSYRDAGS